MRDVLSPGLEAPWLVFTSLGFELGLLLSHIVTDSFAKWLQCPAAFLRECMRVPFSPRVIREIATQRCDEY